MKSHQIMDIKEIQAVVAEIKIRINRGSDTARKNLMVFRLSTCCGLRRKEIRLININDFVVYAPKPVIEIQDGVGKYGKARTVPLWWDSETFEDIKWFWEIRHAQSLNGDEPLLVSKTNKRLHLKMVAKRFKTCLAPLHEQRREQLSIHDGRHTFISHAVTVRSLAEVRDAVGHASIETTNQYIHAINKNADDIFKGEDSD